MLYLYDKALTEKLRKFYPRVVYSPVNTFYTRYLEDVNNVKGRIQLPALSIWRISQEFNPYNARGNLNTPVFTKHRPNHDNLEYIYSMQMPLKYQLDIWASTDIDRDDMLQELLYALTLYPDLVINYRGQLISFPVIIESVDNTTEIDEFESTGDLYRYSIELSLDSARLLYYQKSDKVTRFINFNITNEPYVADDEQSFNESFSLSVTDEEWNKFLSSITNNNTRGE